MIDTRPVFTHDFRLQNTSENLQLLSAGNTFVFEQFGLTPVVPAPLGVIR